MRKQAGKLNGKQAKKAATAVSAPKPNGAKTRRSATALSSPPVDTPDEAATAVTDTVTSVSDTAPAKRSRAKRENKNKKNAKNSIGRDINSSTISADAGESSGNTDAGESSVNPSSDSAALHRPGLSKSEILQADTFVHVKSEILQAEYLEKLQQQQRQFQLQQLQEQQQQQIVHNPTSEKVESVFPHHHQQHLQQQEHQALYHYQEQARNLVESAHVSAPSDISLVQNIPGGVRAESSPSQQRPSSVPEPGENRSPLSIPHHHHHQQQQQQQQYPPLVLTPQQQHHYQHYQHDHYSPEHQHQHHLQQQHHQDLMHATPLENDVKDSPPPLLMPASSYVNTTSHPVLMSGSTTTQLIHAGGHEEATGMVFAHQHHLQQHDQQHQHHHHHQLLYEVPDHDQRNDNGELADAHAQSHLQPPLAHSRGSADVDSGLPPGLGGRISTIHIPPSSLAGLSGNGDLQVMDNGSPGPAQMPSIDHQQLAQQLAEISHSNQTFTMLTNVNSLSSVVPPGMLTKRGGTLVGVDSESAFLSPIRAPPAPCPAEGLKA
ncbi:hypothetical protein PoB_000132400 [Plakobranchus ocellatus]|uniref:Uncharacterized protein n=1 Tax=Plakobranchus ocellatus TaxID=259542 RepID=A0AAV3XVC1_9GAST|nr:hypothetical protein PoB_000132400 [Plakobranchus ocellatus]